MRGLLPGLLLLAGASCAAAEPVAVSEAMQWLTKIATAARQTNYSGTFVYQHGRQSETSTIAHVASSSGEYERLEVLDGSPREIIRNNDNVTCYFPQEKSVVIEKRTMSSFPSLLPEQLSSIEENYVVKKGDHDRVAGYECQVVKLEPRDNLRYGHDFCVELVSGLPLRARMYSDQNELVESFAFTQLRTGNNINKDLLRSRYANKSQGWHIDRSALQHTTASAESGWVSSNQPAGFRKIIEMKRSIPGSSAQAAHIVYSDGLAAVSVFIEPLPKSPPPSGAAHQGAVNIFVRPFTDHMLTVVGETPARTVRQIAESFNLSR